MLGALVQDEGITFPDFSRAIMVMMTSLREPL